MTRKAKRAWLVVVVTSLAIGVTVAAWLWWDAAPGPAEAYKRIGAGATRQEVVSLIGPPDGKREDFSRWLNNRTPRIPVGDDLLNEQRHLPGIEYWYSDRGVLILRFGSDNRVAGKQFLRITVSTPRQWVYRVLEPLGL